MKEFKNIEKKLRNAKLPDSDMSDRFGYTWKKVLEAHRKRREKHLSFFISPWAWPVASVIILFLFFVFVFLIRC